MPKYYYSCQECEHSFRAYHSPKESLKNCPKCSKKDCLKKQINKVFILSKDEQETNTKVGEITKQAIEENREILKMNKRKAESTTYED